MQDLSTAQLHRFNACRFAAIQLYVVGLTFVKLSFLAQYYRTFADRTIRRICMCFAFYCCLWMVVQAILYSFSCIPIQYLFPATSDMCIRSAGICEFFPYCANETHQPRTKEERTILLLVQCFSDSVSSGSAIAIINVLTDAIIFCIPLKPLYRMPLVKRQNYLLSGIFFFGFV